MKIQPLVKGKSVIWIRRNEKRKDSVSFTGGIIMGYRIAYRSYEKTHFRNCKRSQIPKRWIAIGCTCLVLAASAVIWKYEAIRTFFLPGDPEVTAAAFGELVNCLRSGEDFREAVTAFCIEVLENAQIAK